LSAQQRLLTLSDLMLPFRGGGAVLSGGSTGSTAPVSGIGAELRDMTQMAQLSTL
jgi:hypothetical protein